jgi:hypothetical protein
MNINPLVKNLENSPISYCDALGHKSNKSRKSSSSRRKNEAHNKVDKLVERLF